MNESVKSKSPARVEIPASVDTLVRNMTREQEAAGEMAAGLRDVLQGDLLVENAKRVTKCVDTLQIVASVLFQDPERGGTSGEKKAFQDHLVALRDLSTRCSTRHDFADEAALHREAFKLCKQLERTPRLLADAMNINFEVLVDLRSSQAQSVATHKKSLLVLLRTLGQSYAVITSTIHAPDLRLTNPVDTRKQIWRWYRRVIVVLWLLWSLWLLSGGAGIFKGFLLITFGSVALFFLSTLLVSQAIPLFESLALRLHRKRLADLGILPDKKGKYPIHPNGLAITPDYNALQTLLLARGQNWHEFE
jgi:hypothetical protein